MKYIILHVNQHRDRCRLVDVFNAHLPTLGVDSTKLITILLQVFVYKHNCIILPYNNEKRLKLHKIYQNISTQQTFTI